MRQKVFYRVLESMTMQIENKFFLFTCKQYLKFYTRFSHNHVFKVCSHGISRTIQSIAFNVLSPI